MFKGCSISQAATSSPELFINCVGTFITKGDIGVGTVVGSAVFNILAVPACCGLFAGQVKNLFMKTSIVKCIDSFTPSLNLSYLFFSDRQFRLVARQQRLFDVWSCCDSTDWSLIRRYCDVVRRSCAGARLFILYCWYVRQVKIKKMM